MMTVLEMALKERKDQLNRAGSRQHWWTFYCDTGSVVIQIKAFDTWVQRINIGGDIDSGPMDCTIKTMREYLSRKLAFLD